jgi:sporulation-control protein
MFKKFLAKLGKGAATVDLRFENRPYQAGDTVQGEVLIKGGEVEQTINHLAARFIMSVSTKQGERVSREVDTIPLAGSIYILSKDQNKRMSSHLHTNSLWIYRFPVVLFRTILTRI